MKYALILFMLASLFGCKTSGETKDAMGFGFNLGKSLAQTSDPTLREGEKGIEHARKVLGLKKFVYFYSDSQGVLVTGISRKEVKTWDRQKQIDYITRKIKKAQYKTINFVFAGPDSERNLNTMIKVRNTLGDTQLPKLIFYYLAKTDKQQNIKQLVTEMGGNFKFKQYYE